LPAGPCAVGPLAPHRHPWPISLPHVSRAHRPRRADRRRSSNGVTAVRRCTLPPLCAHAAHMTRRGSCPTCEPPCQGRAAPIKVTGSSLARRSRTTVRHWRPHGKLPFPASAVTYKAPIPLPLAPLELPKPLVARVGPHPRRSEAPNSRHGLPPPSSLAGAPPAASNPSNRP
jgi:hypothetical protein